MAIEKRRLAVELEVPKSILKTEDAAEIKKQLQTAMGVMGVRVISAELKPMGATAT